MYAARVAGSMHGPVERAAFANRIGRAGGEKASVRAGVTSTARTGGLPSLYLTHLEALTLAFGDESHALLAFAFHVPSASPVPFCPKPAGIFLVYMQHTCHKPPSSGLALRESGWPVPSPSPDLLPTSSS